MNLIFATSLLLLSLPGWAFSSEPSLNPEHSDIQDIQRDEVVDTAMEEKEESGKYLLFGGLDSRYQTWILSLIASCVIGLSGIVPLVFIPLETGIRMNEGQGKQLRLLLSFAVGGLLGDVFLHLLPEAWDHQKNSGSETNVSYVSLGLSVLIGMFSFTILERIIISAEANRMNFVPPCGKVSITRNASFKENHTDVSSGSSYIPVNSSVSDSACFRKTAVQNGHCKIRSEQNGSALKVQFEKKSTSIHVTGYLNLMANCIDNFTHGLAVAASFLVGCKMGILTTFAILIHEIPHEIGDFAILLKSGFHPWTAAKAQISTATIGILGVVVALSADSIHQVGLCTSWILPFTAGGFLNIALVNVLPDLLNENDPWESVKQFLCLCAGIGVMACVGLFI